MSSMTRFEKQCQIEKTNIISKAQCIICQKPIGNSAYLAYQERYFHKQCLKGGKT